MSIPSVSKPVPVRRTVYRVSPEQQVLVAMIKTGDDFRIARDEGWYRIPVSSAPKHDLDAQTLAFYQPARFAKYGDAGDGMAIHFWARVQSRRVVQRFQLFPNDPRNSRSDWWYYQFRIGPLQRLPVPILNSGARPINVFIPTTRAKFFQASDINDIFHDSPLEDLMWKAFGEQCILTERQYHVHAPDDQKRYVLDFALFCHDKTKIAVECDGDTWHSEREQIACDNQRDNLLGSLGWTTLRFNTRQLRDEPDVCLQRVRETIHVHGGLVTKTGEHRWYAEQRKGVLQGSLFDGTHDYTPTDETG